MSKLARSQGQDFDCATWLHKARTMAKEGFKQEVERELTGDSEPYELVTFKLYKSQLPVVEQALDTAGLMLGTGGSRGYCLEMICADFLAGVGAHTSNTEMLLSGMREVARLLPDQMRNKLCEQLRPAGSR